MATEMSTAKTVSLIAAILLIGPVMFIVSRGLSLARAFDQVKIGDTDAAVKHTMGAPPEDVQGKLHITSNNSEYRYSIWPIPKTWIIRMKDGKVVDKESTGSP
jgi:hypothetical protein